MPKFSRLSSYRRLSIRAARTERTENAGAARGPRWVRTDGFAGCTCPTFIRASIGSIKDRGSRAAAAATERPGDAAPRRADRSGAVYRRSDAERRSQQFESLGTFLDLLLGRLRELGSEAVLFAVPGNHDLVRPTDRTWPRWCSMRGKNIPRCRKHFGTRREEPRPVSQADLDSVCKLSIVCQVVAAQTSAAVVDRSPRAGTSAGDFAATIDRNGAKLMIAGLNSAFAAWRRILQRPTGTKSTAAGPGRGTAMEETRCSAFAFASSARLAESA